MGWPYHFVDLTSAQKQHRRELLDWYGALAQLSVLVPILVLQLRFLIAWIDQRRAHQNALSSPSSPYTKQQRLHGGLNQANRFISRARSLAWWLGDSIELSGYHFGTKGEVIGASFWAAWLFLLCFLQTGDDYYHLTKRFGIVGASQLPFHYLLALKSPYSPLQLLTRRSHESLNVLHQLLGRVVTVLFYLHAAFYINFYIAKGLLGNKVTEFYIICGILGILAFTAIGTTALAPVKRWSYRVFYITHISLATVLPIVLFFHVSHIRIYLYETAAVYALAAVLRLASLQTLTGTVKLLPNANLVEIDIPVPKASSKTWIERWQPGQHAYISLAKHQSLLRRNPFTVASIPQTDGRLRFIARVLDGNTAQLARLDGSSQDFTLEGPYGLATHGERLLQYDRILLIAGGVGATFVVPLYRQLLADLSPSKGSYRRQKVSLLWIARTYAEVLWAVPQGEKEKEGFVDRLRVCLTGKEAAELARTDQGGFTVGGDTRACATLGETEDGIELEEQKTLLSGDVERDLKEDGGDLAVSVGRPNVKRVLEQTFSHGGSEKVAIMVCGPRPLSQTVRQEVAPWIQQGRDIWFWEESFAL